MTQAQLDRSVATRTGESLRTVHRLGFQPDRAGALELEEIRLVVDCNRARSAANSLAPAAAVPSRPDSDVGSPTMTSIAPSLTASGGPNLAVAEW